jgi:hypothetical protein
VRCPVLWIVKSISNTSMTSGSTTRVPLFGARFVIGVRARMIDGRVSVAIPGIPSIPEVCALRLFPDKQANNRDGSVVAVGLTPQMAS